MGKGPGRLGRALGRLREFARRPQPPPALPASERFLYGAAQPALGLRLVLRDRELRAAALKPALLLAAFCAFVAMLSDGSFLRRFYQIFAVLAPLPSVIFAAHYARMAAAVRNQLGFGPVKAKEDPLHVAVYRVIAQAVLVAAGLLPIVLVLKLVPGLGKPLAQALAGAWALHWVVIDAYDQARVLKPGETLRSLDRQAELTRRPWFVRFFKSAGDGLPGPFGAVFRAFAGIIDRLSKSWREELALAERHPALAAGFALTTGVLLATPVLNLFFRPIILAASAHLLGHLEKTEQAAPAIEAAPLPLPAVAPLPRVGG